MPANGVVVSTHTNESGPNVCDRTRAVPGGCAATDECGLIEPASPAEAVPMYRIGGTCANEGGSNSHNRVGAVHTKDSCPPSFVFSEATSERDVVGPMPRFARFPNMRGGPFILGDYRVGTSHPRRVCTLAKTVQTVGNGLWRRDGST